MRVLLTTAILYRKTTFSFTRLTFSKASGSLFRFNEQERTQWRFKRINQFLTTKSDESSKAELLMENLYTEWTLQDDKTLYENRSESIPKLASMLGRGLRGVSSRLDKLKNVNSGAYARLFIGERDDQHSRNVEESMKKLTPAMEIMRRIKWDYTLVPNDFEVLYYDRVEKSILSCPFDAVNDSVPGKERQLVFAIPEHRIMVSTNRKAFGLCQVLTLIFYNFNFSLLNTKSALFGTKRSV